MLWCAGAVGLLIFIGVLCQMISNKYEEVDRLTELLEISYQECSALRAELISSYGENHELLGKVKNLEDYNKRLLGNQIQEHNKCCRVNPGNPNIVKAKPQEPEIPI